MVDTDSIIIDAKTGVSGAGRSLSQNVHYSEMNENFSAYGIGKHKHKPEIEQYLSINIVQFQVYVYVCLYHMH